MATVAAVIASTHHPFYYRASTSAGADRPPVGGEWVAKIEAFRQTLTRAEPDVLVMVGSDHFHQLWLDNMPQFLVGKAPFFDANWYNEEREFGLPRMRLAGDEDLAAYLLREGLDTGFDLAFSNELRIDHSVTCPIITLRPQAGLPVGPVYTNIFAPPITRRLHGGRSWASTRSTSFSTTSTRTRKWSSATATARATPSRGGSGRWPGLRCTAGLRRSRPGFPSPSTSASRRARATT